MRLRTSILAIALATAAHAAPELDSGIHPDDLRDWMKTMAAEPNQVGSPHDKANADYELGLFRAWGWDAHIETFEVLYPTPLSETLELTAPEKFTATLQEKPVPGDATSARTAGALPAYVAYQSDGDVTAPLVYINYGMQDDYKALERLGVDVRGKIVIARYGHGWRGLKPKLAQDHGAIGCIIYSDPADDGYSQEKTYPEGPMRPPQGIQRGSVADMPLYPGDPLTPGIGATHDAKRLARADAPTILKIPVLPISYADAQHFLAALDGAMAPEGFRGGLPITYHVGPGPAVAHLAVKSDWGLKTIYDVIATMRGSELPDQWVIRGNHHDGWVFGASDPLSGQVALMAEAKAIGAMVAQGYHPRRTLIYASWDAEEPMLLGSTEWVETHADALKKHAVLYINSDGNGRGILSAGGSADLTHLVNQVAAEVTDPETKVSIGTRLRAQLRVDGAAPDATPEAVADGKLAADNGRDFRKQSAASCFAPQTIRYRNSVPATSPTRSAPMSTRSRNLPTSDGRTLSRKPPCCAIMHSLSPPTLPSRTSRRNPCSRCPSSISPPWKTPPTGCITARRITTHPCSPTAPSSRQTASLASKPSC